LKASLSSDSGHGDGSAGQQSLEEMHCKERLEVGIREGYVKVIIIASEDKITMVLARNKE
jgi:hypothetical protein